MSELRARLLAAENAGGAAADGGDFGEVFVTQVKRGRARRTALLATASAVAVVALGAATFAVMGRGEPVEPAQPAPPPTVTGDIVEAVEVTRLDATGTPGDIASRRAWDQIDDSWALALWRSNTDPGNLSGLEIVAVGPDGTTLDVGPLPGVGSMQIIAWSPIFETALVSTQPEGVDSVSPDAQLGVVKLLGGDDVWTAECSDPETAPSHPVRQVAAPVDGGYAVRNACGEEFFMDGGGRFELTKDQQKVLLNAEYPGRDLTEIVVDDQGAQLHYGAGYMVMGFDTQACELRLRSRNPDSGSGCPEGTSYRLEMHGEPQVLSPFASSQRAVNVSRLCGTEALYGDLSDGTRGVGLVRDDHAVPLDLDGSPATACEDGRLTWYIAGGDLFSADADGTYTRLVDAVGVDTETGGGAGVVDVAPAPFDESLG